MKNKAGRKEEHCRVRRSVGDNQHQVRTADFQVVNDISLQVEALEIGQEIIDPVQVKIKERNIHIGVPPTIADAINTWVGN